MGGGGGGGLSEAAEVHKGLLAPSGPWEHEGGEQLFGDSLALLVDISALLRTSAWGYGVWYKQQVSACGLGRKDGGA